MKLKASHSSTPHSHDCPNHVPEALEVEQLLAAPLERDVVRLEELEQLLGLLQGLGLGDDLKEGQGMRGITNWMTREVLVIIFIINPMTISSSSHFRPHL